MDIEYAVKIVHSDGTKEAKIFKTFPKANHFMLDYFAEHCDDSVSVVPVGIEYCDDCVSIVLV